MEYDDDEDVTKLDISVGHLRSLHSLNSYTQLTDLDCGYNYINKLPELPETLRHLNCGMNHWFAYQNFQILLL